MAYYQLLCGIHSEFGVKHVAGDIIKSEANLPQNFGSDKFRKLSDKEVSQLQNECEPATDAQPKRKRVKRVKRKSA